MNRIKIPFLLSFTLATSYLTQVTANDVPNNTRQDEANDYSAKILFMIDHINNMEVADKQLLHTCHMALCMIKNLNQNPNISVSENFYYTKMLMNSLGQKINAAKIAKLDELVLALAPCQKYLINTLQKLLIQIDNEKKI